MTDTPGRLLRLLSLLQARRDWPGATLAERLAVTPRTVRRDVDRLRELGYPVVATKGPHGGYRLAAGQQMPPLLLDDEQAVALTIALVTAAPSVAGLDDAGQRALATVRQVMPARLRSRVDSLADVSVLRPEEPHGGVEPVSPDVLVALGDAVRAQEVLRFDYAGGSGEQLTDADGATFRPPRRVEPHHVATWSGRWYLVAWDLDRRAWRTFRADRITPRTPTGPHFTRRTLPAPDVATFLGRRLTAREWPCRGEAVVHLDAATLAPWMGDVGSVEDLGPGRCRVLVGSWSWAGLAAWFGRLEVGFEVLGPDELRDACGRLAERYAAASRSV
ncbi:helix-turn-helix transcriptional regulator [Beutenbergia cavernae]|nr:WYL domain-containing protein [Beutenbergia cavernae]